MHDQPNVKLCECGCGTPLRYAHGHAPALRPPNPSGFCMCGCGQRTKIATQTWAAQGYVKGQPRRFVKGHNGRGITPIEAIEKSADLRRGRPLPDEWRRNISLGNGGSGEASPATIHWRLRLDYPPTNVCEECGAIGATHYAFKRHPELHTRNREDYRELCPPCHVQFDLWLRTPEVRLARARPLT